MSKLYQLTHYSVLHCLNIIALLLLLILYPAIGYAGNSAFTVTQYNLTRMIASRAEAENALTQSAWWNGNPITHSYGRIAFIHWLEPERTPHFKSKMVAFPGVAQGTHQTDAYFVLEATATILIPEAGYWTFACGSDDGIKLTISGHGVNKTLDANGGAFQTSLVTICFPYTGTYRLRLFYYNVSWEAALELSVAKGEFSSFNSSAFHLVGEAESGVTCEDEDTCV